MIVLVTNLEMCSQCCAGYEILSTGPDLMVQFTANSNTPGQGFKASYQFQMDDDTNSGLVKYISVELSAYLV